MTANLFGSRLRSRLLTWLFTHSDEDFYVRELEKTLKQDSTNISRELKNLLNLGILTQNRIGHHKYYKVNKKCPFYPELKNLILKTTGAAGSIKEKLAELKGVRYAFIFGSVAKNTENIASDIDLIVVGKMNLDLLNDLISKIEADLKREINYTCYTNEEFEDKIAAKDGFLRNVLKDKKIMLIGKEDEFKRL